MIISIANDFIVLGDVPALKKEKLLNCHKSRLNLFSDAGQKVESQHQTGKPIEMVAVSSYLLAARAEFHCIEHYLGDL